MWIVKKTASWLSDKERTEEIHNSFKMIMRLEARNKIDRNWLN